MSEWKETKSFDFTELKFDATGRTLEGYAAVFNNVDLVGDRIMPGAFKKTITERGQKVGMLWQHDIHEPIGKPVEMREDERGLFVKAVISDTRRGQDALALLRDGAVKGMSIGYDAMPGGTEHITENGKSVRLLKEIRLWEFSLVTMPANEEAGVTALKDVVPTEGKPYNVFHEGDEWCVYKIDADGKPVGKPLGKHPTKPEAEAQMRALYANTDKALALAGGQGKGVLDFNQAMTNEVNERILRDQRWAMRDALDQATESILGDGELDAPAKMTALRTTLTQYADAYVAWAQRALDAGMYEDNDGNSPMKGTNAPSTNTTSEAGPATPPTKEIDADALLKQIEISLFELANMEV